MYHETFMEILDGVWPMLTIILVIIISLRVAYIVKNHKKIALYRELLALIFIVYVISLFHVVSFQDVNFGSNNYIPFKEMFRYELFSPKFMKNILGNVLLFIPFGFFVSYFLKARKIGWPILLTTITSLTIEFVQLKIGRVFDIDDIILNIIGGFIGYLLFVALDAIRGKLPKFFQRDGFLNFILILIIILIIIYVFNIPLFNMLCLN